MDNLKKVKDRFWLWALVSVLALAAVPLVYALMGEATAKNDRYRTEGRVGQGTVTATRAVEEMYEARRGQMKTRTNYFLDISYDLTPTVSYADYVRAGEVLPPGSGSGNISTQSLDSSSAINEAHRTGQAVAVVVVPDDPFNPELFTVVRDYSNWPNYLMMLGGLIIAGLCGWRAVVARREWLALTSYRSATA